MDKIASEFENDNFDVVIELCKERLKNDYFDPEVHYYLAMSYYSKSYDSYTERSELRELAKKHYYSVLDNHKGIPYIFESLYDLERDSVKRKKLLNNGLAKFPDSTELLVLKAETLDHDSRITFISSLEKEHYKSNRMKLLLLEAYLVSGQFGNARSLFNDVEIDGHQLKLLLSAIIDLENQEYESALRVFTSIVDTDYKNDIYYLGHFGVIKAAYSLSRLDIMDEYYDELPNELELEDIVVDWYDITSDDYHSSDINVLFENLILDSLETIVKSYGNKKRTIKAKGLVALYNYYHKSESKKVLKSAITQIEKCVKEFPSCKEYVRCLHSYYVDNRQIEKLVDIVRKEDELGVYYGLDPDVYDEFSLDEKTQFIVTFDNAINESSKVGSFRLINDLLDLAFGYEVYESVVSIYNRSYYMAEVQERNGFWYAFSCAQIGEIDEAIQGYSLLIEKNAKDSSSRNNLAVIYEGKNEFAKAITLVEQALMIDPKKELYKSNLQRFQMECIKCDFKEHLNNDIGITYEDILSAGFDYRLWRSISYIQRNELSEQIKRDCIEITIALINKLYKAVIVLCGSVVEACLLERLKQRNILEYELPKGKTNRIVKVERMSLNELLDVCFELGILKARIYHFTHAIRLYRNIIHPGNEVQSNIEVNKSNAELSWTLVVNVLNDLY